VIAGASGFRVRPARRAGREQPRDDARLAHLIVAQSEHSIEVGGHPCAPLLDAGPIALLALAMQPLGQHDRIDIGGEDAVRD